MKIAFLGTGLMGAGFVRGLLSRGHEVTAWNRTPDKTQVLAAEGARAAATPAEAVAGVERVYLSLSDDAAVGEVLRAALPALAKDVPIVDLTTTAPFPTRARAAQLAAAGHKFLHAPVFMGPDNARLAQGLMLCAGPEELYQALRPELEKMTGKLWYLGKEPGRAAAFKLFGNTMFFAVVGGLADILTVGRAAGIAPAEVMELFQYVDPSRQIGYRGSKMARGDFAASFELSMARKDVRLALETAQCLPDPRLALLPQLAARMDALLADGHGRDDLGVLALDAVRPESPPRRRVLASTPVLMVADVGRSAEFYRRVLGYCEPALFGDPPDFGMLHREEHDLMLARAEGPEEIKPHGAFGRWDVHLRVADLDTERRAIEAAGGTIAAERLRTEYGMAEIEVIDPDGNRICLGQDIDERRIEDVGR